MKIPLVLTFLTGLFIGLQRSKISVIRYSSYRKRFPAVCCNLYLIDIILGFACPYHLSVGLIPINLSRCHLPYWSLGGGGECIDNHQFHVGRVNKSLPFFFFHLLPLNARVPHLSTQSLLMSFLSFFPFLLFLIISFFPLRSTVYTSFLLADFLVVYIFIFLLISSLYLC